MCSSGLEDQGKWPKLASTTAQGGDAHAIAQTLYCGPCVMTAIAVENLRTNVDTMACTARYMLRKPTCAIAEDDVVQLRSASVEGHVTLRGT